MPNKDGSAIRGEPGHFRYKKDMALGNKFDKNGLLIGHGPPEKGVTSIETPGLEKEDKASVAHGTPDPKGIYTKEVAKGFNKTEQKNLLKARGVTFPSTIKEKGLVNKILKSNPKEENKPSKEELEELKKKPAEEEADVPPEPPPETAKKQYGAELENYKTSALVTILRSLGIKKIPLTNKGKIKKILETQ